MSQSALRKTVPNYRLKEISGISEVVSIPLTLKVGDKLLEKRLDRDFLGQESVYGRLSRAFARFRIRRAEIHVSGLMGSFTNGGIVVGWTPEAALALDKTGVELYQQIAGFERASEGKIWEDQVLVIEGDGEWRWSTDPTTAEYSPNISSFGKLVIAVLGNITGIDGETGGDLVVSAKLDVEFAEPSPADRLAGTGAFKRIAVACDPSEEFYITADSTSSKLASTNGTSTVASDLDNAMLNYSDAIYLCVFQTVDAGGGQFGYQGISPVSLNATYTTDHNGNGIYAWANNGNVYFVDEASTARADGETYHGPGPGPYNFTVPGGQFDLLELPKITSPDSASSALKGRKPANFH
jgi:hypothetical protein